MRLANFGGEALDHAVVEPDAPLARERFPGQFEQGPAVGRRHQPSPTLMRVKRVTEMALPTSFDASATRSADRLLVVLDPGLVQQRALGEKLLDLPFDDLGANGLGLSFLGHLLFGDATLPVHDVGADVLGPHRDRVGGGDVERDLAGQLLGAGSAGHAFAAALELHQHADLAVVVEVEPDQSGVTGRVLRPRSGATRSRRSSRSAP